MRFVKWLKTWGALLVAAIALGLSGFVIYLDNVHYQEVTKPHTQHDEIYDRLVRLDYKIERVEQSINDLRDIDWDISEPQKYLRKAKELRDQAELAWDTAQYIEADEFIKEAHDTIQEIPPLPISWSIWLWVFLGTIVVVGALTIWVYKRQRG